MNSTYIHKYEAKDYSQSGALVHNATGYNNVHIRELKSALLITIICTL